MICYHTFAIQTIGLADTGYISTLHYYYIIFLVHATLLVYYQRIKCIIFGGVVWTFVKASCAISSSEGIVRVNASLLFLLSVLVSEGIVRVNTSLLFLWSSCGSDGCWHRQVLASAMSWGVSTGAFSQLMLLHQVEGSCTTLANITITTDDCNLVGDHHISRPHEPIREWTFTSIQVIALIFVTESLMLIKGKRRVPLACIW